MGCITSKMTPRIDAPNGHRRRSAVSGERSTAFNQ